VNTIQDNAQKSARKTEGLWSEGLGRNYHRMFFPTSLEWIQHSAKHTAHSVLLFGNFFLSIFDPWLAESLDWETRYGGLTVFQQCHKVVLNINRGNLQEDVWHILDYSVNTVEPLLMYLHSSVVTSLINYFICSISGFSFYMRDVKSSSLQIYVLHVS
jgi:hypothetical protein